jgi:protein TonB
MNTSTAQVFTLPEREFQQGILEMVKAGGYSAVLETLQAVRLKDPRNIFIIAMERQAKRMEGLAECGGEGSAEMATLMESLPALIQRAWADAKARGMALPVPGMEEPVPVPPPPSPMKRSIPADTAFHRPVVPATAAPAHETVAAGVTDRSGSSSKVLWFAVAATVLVLSIAVTYFVMRNSKQSRAVVAPAQPDPTAQESTPAEPRPEPKLEVQNEPLKEPDQTPSVTPVEQRSSSVTERQPERQSRAAEKKPATTIAPEPTKTGSTQTEIPVKLSVAALAPGQVTTPPQTDASTTPASAETQPAAENSEPFIPVQKEPRVVKLVEPDLGEAIRMRRTDGEIIARVLINTEGKALKVRIVKSTNTLLNQAVAQALLKSEFEPGVMTNGPVQSWLTVPFRFR